MPSEQLSVLLERIRQPRILYHRIHPEKPKRKRLRTSKNLLNLLDRIETRRWVEATKPELEARIDALNKELKVMKHMENCGRCLMELQLDVERYNGTRCFWWLDLNNDPSESYEDCPKPENYKIGSYWTGSSDDTMRFIKDRIAWARIYTLKEIRATGKARSLLEHWDFSRSDEFREMYESLLYSNFFLWGEIIPTMRSLFSFEQFEEVLQKLAHEIATEALMAPLRGDVRIIIYGGRLSTVETNKHLIRFFARHIAYTEHDGHSWEHSWGFDVEDKLYLTSDDCTKISYYAPEGKEKETIEKITRFIDKIMAEASIKPVPRFTLAKIAHSK